LTRDGFKTAVFSRDKNICVICNSAAVDAHHLFERRLWIDQGYYVDNGVSVCSNCHYEAELTTLSVEQLRASAKITNILVPPGFDSMLVC
jgi:hypothetical protein